MQFHSVIIGIVAPIVPNFLEELILKRRKIVGFNLPVHNGTHINVCFRVLMIIFIFSQSLIKLFNSILSCKFVEHTDAHITWADNLIVIILRSGACTIRREVLPPTAFYAYTSRFKNVVKACNQSMQTISIIDELIAGSKKNCYCLHIYLFILLSTLSIFIISHLLSVFLIIQGIYFANSLSSFLTSPKSSYGRMSWWMNKFLFSISSSL